MWAVLRLWTDIILLADPDALLCHIEPFVPFTRYQESLMLNRCTKHRPPAPVTVISEL